MIRYAHNIAKYFPYLTIGLLQLLWAQLALHVPNASNPLADKLEEYYLFYIFCTFLFFRLFTHNVQVRERKRAQRVYKIGAYDGAYSLLPVFLFSFYLLISLMSITISQNISIIESGYLKGEYPLLVSGLFLTYYFVRKYPEMDIWFINKEEKEAIRFSVLKVRYKQNTLFISLEDVAVLIFLTPRCLIITRDGRLMYRNKLTQPKLWNLKGTGHFINFNGNGVARKKWIEGMTDGKEKFLVMKPCIQQHIDRLLGEGEELKDPFYDRDVLRQSKLKVNHRFIKNIQREKKGFSGV